MYAWLWMLMLCLWTWSDKCFWAPALCVPNYIDIFSRCILSPCIHLFIIYNLATCTIEVDHRDLVSLLSFILRSREAVKWHNTIEVTMAFLLIITLRTYIAPIKFHTGLVIQQTIPPWKFGTFHTNKKFFTALNNGMLLLSAKIIKPNITKRNTDKKCLDYNSWLCLDYVLYM